MVHFTLEPRYFSAIDEIREASAGITPVGSENAAGIESQRHAKREQGDGHSYPVAYCNPLGKLPGSVWSIPSEPLQVPDHLGVDHFAAFPQEWPRRLILGWCPQEVCSECGEGRGPVVEKELHQTAVMSGRPKTATLAVPEHGVKREGGWDRAGYPSGTVSATITGFACACSDTSAPSTPGVVLDPFVGTGTVPMVARALGRTGIGVDLSADYMRLANWRVFQSGHAAKTMQRTNAERQGALL